EGTKAVRPFWAGGRLSGVWTASASGEEVLIRARAVIGADGRRSAGAGGGGPPEPYRMWPNQRGMVWYYVDDPRPVRDSWLMTRVSDTIRFIITFYYCALVLFM